jgi:hypothetical protein
VKLEVLGDPKTLLPDPIGTLEATRELVRQGFQVLVYCSDDPRMAVRWRKPARGGHAGRLADRIGPGRAQPNAIRIALELVHVPVIVDAGVGTASDVALRDGARRRGRAAQHGIASARDPLRMAAAMRDACRAGRNAFLRRRIPRKLYANASSPESGAIAPSAEAAPARSGARARGAPRAGGRGREPRARLDRPRDAGRRAHADAAGGARVRALVPSGASSSPAGVPALGAVLLLTVGVALLRARTGHVDLGWTRRSRARSRPRSVSPWRAPAIVRLARALDPAGMSCLGLAGPAMARRSLAGSPPTCCARRAARLRCSFGLGVRALGRPLRAAADRHTVADLDRREIALLFTLAVVVQPPWRSWSSAASCSRSSCRTSATAVGVALTSLLFAVLHGPARSCPCSAEPAAGSLMLRTRRLFAVASVHALHNGLTLSS